MSNKKYSWKKSMLVTLLLLWVCSMTVLASSSDNSLSSLGITTEGAIVSPEFYYSTIEYEVTVPAGTTRLELDPVTSNPNAWIVDIMGQDLTDGKTTVQIVVSAENGNQYSYYLYVTADESAGTAAAAEPETEAQTETEPETEPETEDPRYVKVDRDTMQAASDTVEALKKEVQDYRDRLGMMMKILYGLIAFCVILLFAVINLILKKKDLKKELENYMGYGQPEYNNGGYDGQAYEQSYDQDYTQAYETQEYGTGYDQNYAQQEYGQGYDQQSYSQNSAQDTVKEQPRELQWEPQVSTPDPVMNDDPQTVPKPSKARKKNRRMPEYEQRNTETVSNAPQATQQSRKGKSSENVEVTMIDL